MHMLANKVWCFILIYMIFTSSTHLNDKLILKNEYKINNHRVNSRKLNKIQQNLNEI